MVDGNNSGAWRGGNVKACLLLFEIESVRIHGVLTRQLCVVPAKAGTHNHRRLMEQKPLAIVLKKWGRGVWVPAFAGTTSRRNCRAP